MRERTHGKTVSTGRGTGTTRFKPWAQLESTNSKRKLRRTAISGVFVLVPTTLNLEEKKEKFKHSVRAKK